MADILMTLWVVYDNPRDLPGRFVVRPQSVVRHEKGYLIWPHALHYVCGSLKEARKHVPPFLHRLPRADDDGEDPAIAETWI